MSEDKREKLKEFYFRIKECMECELGKTRTNFVFGSGNPGAEIVFIGEAPAIRTKRISLAPCRHDFMWRIPEDVNSIAQDSDAGAALR